MLNLVMVFHCHQPVGNFDDVFEMAFQKCYGPILEHLKSYPGVKAGLHFSGPLLEWMEKHHPLNLDFMAEMVQRGQVETLSGGFFEPLLATIPTRDAEGQVQMMNQYLTRRFGRKPTGFWLTERVWDSSIPLKIARTKLDYTIVDDTHLYYAGIKSHKIYGSYITEKEGATLSLLATPMIMRYIIPFKPVEEVINHLRWMHDEGQTVALYGDDGEKFGLWPGTHDWVIKQGWLKDFFAAIQDNSEWLQTTLPGDFISENKPLGRIYLPQASYEEMTEWALPHEQGQKLEDIIKTLQDENRWETWRPFVRGGIWDNFLVKYDESNRMHKKMLFLSDKVSEDNEAREYLWRAQCNCAYWHGVFGGLYLGHLRRAIHENLLMAQSCIMKNNPQELLVYETDLDKDGTDEILIWNQNLSIALAPYKGASIFEIAYLPKKINISDVLTRHPEAYHRHIQTNEANDNMASNDQIASIHAHPKGRENLKKHLIIDSYTKVSLLDHFLKPDLTVEDYNRNNYEEVGNFIGKPYEIKEKNILKDSVTFNLSRKSSLGSDLLTLRKKITVKKSCLTADYLFDWHGKESYTSMFGCEFNLSLFSDQDKKRYYFLPETGRRREIAEIGVEEDIIQFDLVNSPDKLIYRFSFSSPVSIWFFPIMTISKSEDGFERTYQGSSLLFCQLLDLNKEEDIKFQLQLELNEV